MNRKAIPEPGTPGWHIHTLTESARQLAKNGNYADAEKIYEQILDAAPYHIRSLNFLATRAMERGDSARALALYERALEVDTKRPIIHQNIGILLLAENDPESALRCFQNATNLREDFIYSWIYQGDIHLHAGRKDDAITAYARALKLLPSISTTLVDGRLPETKRKLIRNAAAGLYTLKYEYFTQALAGCLEKYGDQAMQRVLKCARIKSGLAEPEYLHALQHPDWMYMPDVEPRPFFDTRDFKWMHELEIRHTEIRHELDSLLAHPEDLEAYVNIEGKDTRQWSELNHSKDWSSYHLYRGGEPITENCKRCPVTADILSGLPLIKIPGHAAEAFFSILRPGTHIPPHHGVANYKLAVHLPLAVPDQCAIRVGYETRTWTEGKCLVFDDSFQHEAWNKSDRLRAVLIFEIWNPLLSPAERSGLTSLVQAVGEFNRKFEA